MGTVIHLIYIVPTDTLNFVCQFMSCFNPNYIKRTVDSDTGSIVSCFCGPAKYLDFSLFGSMDDLFSKGFYYALIPCGKCLGCRIDYARDWCHRMCFELKDNDEKAIFLTLTYNNENVPRSDSGALTLCKRDLQLFFKRLRKFFSDRKIRFYIAGEYGPRTFRPHYHSIVYGLTLSDFPDLRLIGSNELKDPYFSSPTLEKIWSNGFVLFSSVSYKTCSYVSRYVLKKRFRSDFSPFDDRLPEFNLSSRRPGIGFTNAYKYVSSGLNFFDFAFSDGQHTISLPTSFIRHCKRSEFSIEFLDDILYNRSVDAYDRLFCSLRFFEKSFFDFLSTKEHGLRDRLSVLPSRIL